MNKFLKSFVVLILLLTVISCNSTRQKGEQASTDQPKNASSLKLDGQNIPPGQCRIIGTIVSINEIKKTGNADDPCSKTPCQAVVRVDSVLGYGQGYVRPLAKSKEVPVTFRFTLSPTEKFFKNMTTTYPGLEEGSTFMADVEVQQLIGSKSFQYSISGYEIK